MAVGRLAHTSVAAGGYATVYNNSSGTPAVVSVIVGAPTETTFSVRVTDASSYDFVNDVDLVTESYNTDDIRINASTTDVISRQQFTSDTDNHTTEYKTVNYYLESNSTLYKAAGGQNLTTVWDAPTYLNTNYSKSFVVVGLENGATANLNEFYSVDISGYGGTGQFDDEDSRNYRVLTRRRDTDPDGNTWSSANYNHTQAVSYGNRATTYDPWWHKVGLAGMPIIGLTSNQYMTGIHQYASSANSNNRTTDSRWYDCFGSGSVTTPSAQYSYPYLRASGNVFVYDTCNQGPDTDYRGFIIFSCDSAQTSNLVSGLIENNTSYSNGIKGNTQTYASTGYDGGRCIFCEYSPADQCTYVMFRWTDTDQQMYKVKPDTFFDYTSGNYGTDVDNWWEPNMTTFAFELDTHGIERLDTSDWSFPTLSNAPFNNTNSTYRVYYIDENRWAMVAFNMSTGARDILTSTDLKTWVTYDTSFSPYKYSVKSTNDSTVTILHNNTKLYYTEDNFVNIGTDGILESDTQAIILERTGLMMDDGDKLIVHNKGSVAMSVQVMGYEGQE